ncbi:ADP-sugar pyrophosphatase-like [Schistocerca gregaria]|uniref:ADP-sugar pyrophosphatase-like n=1 Tax=Schistocerca gregaria TaxID=7010 RepID=UPI00211E72E3|nr:ADP-sugar pyrophosphatase-like [Schistocerca gregaria]
MAYYYPTTYKKDTLPKVTNKKLVSSTPWIEMYNLTYMDPSGSIRSWDSIERTGSSKLSANGVDILAIVRNNSKCDTEKPLLIEKDDRILLVIQFRPPMNKHTLEFPAGLCEENESIEETAVRELREETGYHGKFVSCSPGIVLDPGISNNCTALAQVLVDLDSPENKDPKQSLDSGEFIQVVSVPFEDMLDHINDICLAKNAVCDAKLYAFAFARSF